LHTVTAFDSLFPFQDLLPHITLFYALPPQDYQDCYSNYLEAAIIGSLSYW
jgi:hypothetical protein